MTKVSAGGATAIFNNEEKKWFSSNKAFENTLNDYYSENAPSGPSNPFPAGVAVELAQRQMSDLKIIGQDKPSEYKKEVVY